MAGNTLGRRVMKDQQGNPLGPEKKDEDLLCDHGFYER